MELWKIHNYIISSLFPGQVNFNSPLSSFYVASILKPSTIPRSYAFTGCSYSSFSIDAIHQELCRTFHCQSSFTAWWPPHWRILCVLLQGFPWLVITAPCVALWIAVTHTFAACFSIRDTDSSWVHTHSQASLQYLRRSLYR